MPHTALQRHSKHWEKSSGFCLSWLLEAEQTLGCDRRCRPPASPADNPLLKVIIRLRILQLRGFFSSWSFRSSSSQPCLLATHTTQTAPGQGLKTLWKHKNQVKTPEETLHVGATILIKNGVYTWAGSPQASTFRQHPPVPGWCLTSDGFCLTPDGFHRPHYFYSAVITSAIVNELSCLRSHFPTNYSELWTTLE